jgi:hypothetical protein
MNYNTIFFSTSDDRISAYQKVASALTSHAINVLNSQDNVTVMIIKIDIADVGADPSHGELKRHLY